MDGTVLGDNEERLRASDRFIMHALGRIEAKVDGYREDVHELRTLVREELSALNARVASLERGANVSTGRSEGVRFMLELLKMAPIGVLSWLLGVEMQR